MIPEPAAVPVYGPPRTAPGAIQTEVALRRDAWASYGLGLFAANVMRLAGSASYQPLVKGITVT